MLDLFSNPAYLAIAAALVSVPIIIHLINRMRFKRIRWAAMEFLLKAQKRTRRRLIIEQLLLLALRCLLVALIGLLVMRFVGLGDWGQLTAKPNVHLVLLDDTLSMNDRWKEGEGAARTAFVVAKDEVLLKKIVENMAKVNPTDRLMIVPYSQLATQSDFTPKVYDHLNDPQRKEALKADLDQMKASNLHVSQLLALKKAQEIANNNPDSRVTLHILSDFRTKEWGQPDGEAVHKALVDLGQSHKDIKIHLIDTVHEYRTAGLGGYPRAHNNVAVLDVRPSTRVAGKNMPVSFTVTMRNDSGEPIDVRAVVRDEASGREMNEVDFNPPMPMKLPPMTTVTATFDYRFDPQPNMAANLIGKAPGAAKPAEPYYALLSVALKNPQLEDVPGDGLPQDNIRYTAVELREKVPILVIDGDGAKGREEGKDSFFISRSLMSVPGASYQIVYGDEIAGGVPTRALERPDLHKYPSIFLLNVPQLTPKQAANLAAYARAGGGVAFFMGPAVNGKYYTKELYKDGQGVFPVPLKDSYFPPATEEPLAPKSPDTFHLILRDEQFAERRAYPIFGMMFEKEEHRNPLRDLPVRRYFQVPRSAWKPAAGRVYELATLPNDQAVTAFTQAVLDLVQGEAARSILKNADYARFRRGLERHFEAIKTLVAPTSEKKAYHLAAALEAFLKDRGRTIKEGKTEKEDPAFPNLTEFWSSTDPMVKSLARDVKALADQVHYGDPFIVSQTFGKGRVVAVLSTAGKEWNDWGGGSEASLLYTPFIWEMQNYLSSQNREANLAVGTPLELNLDLEQYRPKNEPVKLTRSYIARNAEGKPERRELKELIVSEPTKGSMPFRFGDSLEPGLYITELSYKDAADQSPLAVYGHVFNVDAERESALARVSQDVLDREVVRRLPGQVDVGNPSLQPDDLIPRRTDLSESWWLFLVFLGVLVAEQALAVHLSFHLKGNENDALAQVTRAPAPSA